MTAVVDYNAGNIFSVMAALVRLGDKPVLTSDPDAILSADRVVFPGVGYAKAAMAELEKRNLVEVLRAVKAPFLGICLGMQLMCSWSEEGDVDMLGIVDSPVVLFDRALCPKVPQIGWNTVHNLKGPLFEGIREGEWFYFDHSYHAELLPQGTAAATEYCSIEYASAIRKDNFHGVQFHPEKSGNAGSRLLANFLALGGRG